MMHQIHRTVHKREQEIVLISTHVHINITKSYNDLAVLAHTDGHMNYVKQNYPLQVALHPSSNSSCLRT